MKKTSNKSKKVSADEIADMANRGQSISKFFTNKGKMMDPVHRVNVDFTAPMLAELDKMSGELNVSRRG